MVTAGDLHPVVEGLPCSSPLPILPCSSPPCASFSFPVPTQVSSSPALGSSPSHLPCFPSPSAACSTPSPAFPQSTGFAQSIYPISQPLLTGPPPQTSKQHSSLTGVPPAMEAPGMMSAVVPSAACPSSFSVVQPAVGAASSLQRSSACVDAASPSPLPAVPFNGVATSAMPSTTTPSPVFPHRVYESTGYAVAQHPSSTSRPLLSGPAQFASLPAAVGSSYAVVSLVADLCRPCCPFLFLLMSPACVDWVCQWEWSSHLTYSPLFRNSSWVWVNHHLLLLIN